MKIFGRQIFSRIFANGIASNRSSMPKETPVSRCSLSSDCFFLEVFLLNAQASRGPGRPRGTVERRTKGDLAAIRNAMEVARTSGRPFEKVITPTVRFMENKGFYPVPKHGGDRTTAPKRLARLKRTIDEEENLILARALTDASNRRRKPGQ